MCEKERQRNQKGKREWVVVLSAVDVLAIIAFKIIWAVRACCVPLNAFVIFGTETEMSNPDEPIRVFSFIGSSSSLVGLPFGAWRSGSVCPLDLTDADHG